MYLLEGKLFEGWPYFSPLSFAWLFYPGLKGLMSLCLTFTWSCLLYIERLPLWCWYLHMLRKDSDVWAWKVSKSSGAKFSCLYSGLLLFLLGQITHWVNGSFPYWQRGRRSMGKCQTWPDRFDTLKTNLENVHFNSRPVSEFCLFNNVRYWSMAFPVATSPFCLLQNKH